MCIFPLLFLTPHLWQIRPPWLSSDVKLLLLSAIICCRCFRGWCGWLPRPLSDAPRPERIKAMSDGISCKHSGFPCHSLRNSIHSQLFLINCDSRYVSILVSCILESFILPVSLVVQSEISTSLYQRPPLVKILS